MDTNQNSVKPISALYQDNHSQSTYICSRIEDQIAYYERQSAKNKKLFFTMSAVSIVANALIPIFSVYLETTDGNTTIKTIITILSSLSVVITSLLVLFNTKELWAKYRSSASNLTSLLHQYYTLTGVFEDVEGDVAFRLLAKLSEAHFQEENQSWNQMLQHKEKTVSKV